MSTENLTHQPAITLDKHKITDMILVSTSKLMVSIFEQRKIILLDCGSGQVLSEIALHEKPRCLCLTSSHLAATTLVNNKISFITINESILEAASTINVDVNVHGIATLWNNFVISYDPPGVKVISKDGAVIHKLDNKTAGREVFKNPRRIATTPDDSIYVTDWERHELTRLDPSLTILQTFSGSMLKGPHGINESLNKDQLLVCCRGNNSVVLIRPSTNSMTVLLGKQHGIERPQSVCFCKEQKKLYVAPYGDRVLVYQLS